MKYFLSILFIFSIHICFATHNRGGRIEIIQKGPLEVEVIITTYTKTSSIQADRPTLDSVYMGDNSLPLQFSRVSKIDLPHDVSINKYIRDYIYSGFGTYLIHFADPNLNANLINVPNSVSTPFYLETEIHLDPSNCAYFSPLLLSDPIFTTPFKKDFHFSRSCYDPNWDSLSYELDTNFAPGYWIPHGVTLNNITGEFEWIGDSMKTVGEYAFEIKTTKWHRGINSGYMIEHFQFFLESTADSTYHFNIDSLPINLTTHVFAGDLFTQQIEYIDPNMVVPSLQLFHDIPDLFDTTIFTNNQRSYVFSWQTTLQDARTTPFIIVVRGKEDLTYKVYVDGTPTDSCRALVGINEIEKNNFNIFPNPANEYLQISFPDFLNDNIKVSIYDILGKKYIERNLNVNEPINVSALSSGVYLLQIENANKLFYSKLIIERQ